MSETEDKITVENLLKRGYRQFNNVHNLSKCVYQMRVRNQTKTLYFINIYFYPKRENYPHDGFMPEAQMYLDGDHRGFVNLTLGGFDTIQAVEKFFADFYEKMNCSAYGYEE